MPVLVTAGPDAVVANHEDESPLIAAARIFSAKRASPKGLRATVSRSRPRRPTQDRPRLLRLPQDTPLRSAVVETNTFSAEAGGHRRPADAVAGDSVQMVVTSGSTLP